MNLQKKIEELMPKEKKITPDMENSEVIEKVIYNNALSDVKSKIPLILQMIAGEIEKIRPVTIANEINTEFFLKEDILSLFNPNKE